MTKAELLTLADQCEAAPPEQQRALLKEAWRWVHNFGYGPESEADTCRLCDSFTAMLDHHAYVDAALSMLPEGVAWNLGGTPNGGFASAGLFGAMLKIGIYDIHGEAQTPALAILAALLRAKVEEVE